MADIGRKSIGILVFALILTAGFSAFWMSAPAQDETTATIGAESATETPAESSNEPPPFPPGTSESGIDNATRLIITHMSLLANTTYAEQAEWDEVTQVTGENGTVLEYNVSSYPITVKEGADAALITLEGDDSAWVYWVTDEVTAEKTTILKREVQSYTYEPRGVDAEGPNQTRHPLVGFPSRALVYPYLRGVEYDYAGTVTRNNRTLHKFTSAGINETVQDEPGRISSSVETVNATVLIDEEGIIRSFNVSETRSRDNETMTTNTTYSVQQTGNVSPTAPEWVTEELPHLNASLSENGTVIAIDHTGGMPITTTGFLAFTPDTAAYAELNETVELGQTLYLYRTEDVPDQLKVSRNERPETNESFLPFGGENLSLAVRRTVHNTGESHMLIEMEVQNDSSVSSPVPSAARGEYNPDRKFPTTVPIDETQAVHQNHRIGNSSRNRRLLRST